MTKLDYYMPSSPLRQYVSIHCVVETAMHLSERVPALLGQIHICLSGQSAYQYPDGRLVSAPPVSLCGPFNSAFTLHLSANSRFVAIGLLPAGWEALVAAPAAEFADTLIDASLVFKSSAVGELLDLLSHTPTDGSHVRVIERFLERRLCRETGDRRAPGIENWIEYSRDLSVDILAQQLDLSSRHLRRITHARYGGSPKLVAMKYRALRAAAQLTVRGSAGLADAMEGYADQAHFIRDFRRFVGMTPGTFLGEHQTLARATMGGRWRAGARRPLVVWS